MQPTYAEVTIKTLIAFCAVASLLTAFVTFIITQYAAILHMKRKYALLPKEGNGYQLISESTKCMEKRKEAEVNIIKVLRRMEKRMILGNLVMRELIETNNDIEDDFVCKLERDLCIGLEDKNFGIPEE